jgi:transposase
MRKIKDLLRLKYDQKLSHRQIGASLGIAVSSVHEYLERAKAAHITWPQSEQIPEIELESSLFPPPHLPSQEALPLPEWQRVHRELTRKGVTLLLLWEEYRDCHPSGLGYSQFCRRYRTYKATLDPRMRLSHKAGEKLFVDYAGLTLPLTDPKTGEIREVQIFVATLGASSYTYAEATLTQSVPDWIGAHVRAFTFFGGVPELLVCDNLRSGITHACFYEPGVQRTYQEMAAHYGCCVLPTRVRKPRDKAKVESGVQSVEQRLLAPLRNHTFLSLCALNEALVAPLLALNTRPMQVTKQSRADLFAQLERGALRPLPSTPYQVGIWSLARVHLDYHIANDDRFYSVPYTLLKQEVEVREAGNVVEIFHKGVRVASHARVLHKYARSTHPEHMPPAHKEVSRWSTLHLLERASRCGPQTLLVAEAILSRPPHPELGYRSALGLLRLCEKYGATQMERVCQHALCVGATSYRGVKALLEQAVTTATAIPTAPPLPPVCHDNIRGSGYYDALSSTPAEA